MIKLDSFRTISGIARCVLGPGGTPPLSVEIGCDVMGINGIFDTRLKLPIDGFDQTQRGWTCERFVVSASSLEGKALVGSARGPIPNEGRQPLPGFQHCENTHGNNGRRLEIQAELVSTLDKLTRYHSYWTKVAHRAMEALRAAQADRRDMEGGG